MTKDFDPANFTHSTVIDNRYMPLNVHTTLQYADTDAHLTETFAITGRTEVVDGVTCVVVHDRQYVDGQLVEDKREFYAQDDHGNVWLMGVHAEQFAPGNPDDPIGTEGSWIAGVNGALPGVVMEGHPAVGDTYDHETATGVAEGHGEITALDGTADVGYGSYDDLLVTQDTDDVTPGTTEQNYFLEGVGNILKTDNNGGSRELTSIVSGGREGSDEVRGYLGDDIVRGHAGDDTLFGLDGDDIMRGGAGSDTMKGGAGADTFVFHVGNPSTEVDTILDYSAADGDMLLIRNGADSVVAEVKNGHGWTLTLSNGAQIVLQAVHDTNHDGHIVDQLIFG